MGLWHVFYENWQMECCGTPFTVGDEVSWPLRFHAADGYFGGGWYDQLTKVTGEVADVPTEDGAVRVLRDENGLVLALHEDPVDVLSDEDRNAERPGDWIRLVGLLKVETHGARLPETRGRVRAVQLLTQGFAESADAWRPVAGERWLHAVDTCPKWFTDQGVGTNRRHIQAGVVVTLEVPDTDSWLSYAVREATGLPKDAPPGAETAGLDGAALAALLSTFSGVAGPPN
ncbi:DUF6578 domain-containing protein [Streptomyces sp. NPDC050803]|uniref:DUF6578 domain-containing protein n=1 Tax=unclassified Streptomyces TaxID=2593676 RepID=UPI003435C958